MGDLERTGMAAPHARQRRWVIAAGLGTQLRERREAAGCRGIALGGAQVSEKHCNFLINTGTATAADIEGLGEEVRRRVKAATGVTLQWEIRRIGVPGEAVA